MSKIIYGVLIGIFLSISCTFFYRTYWIRDYIIKPYSVAKLDSPKITLAEATVQIKAVSTNFEEKFSSINKRLDDFLVFGGIIITLLLGITVSVYLKTEVEVSKHFKENFGEHSSEAKKQVEEIKKTASLAKQELSVIQNVKSNIGLPNDEEMPQTPNP